MRVFESIHPQDIERIMRGIGVDPGGIKIMLPKTASYLVKINSLSNIAANILKQEMLSLGADAAVSRSALSGRKKTTACLLIGALHQLSSLEDKLKDQPFGLSELGAALACALANYRREQYCLDLGRYKLDLTSRPCIMGIVNLTPDSFSGDGLYSSQGSVVRGQGAAASIQGAIDYAQKLADDGADIIDLGGESTRPGARVVSMKEELPRVVPIIKALAKKIKTPISIDTYKPQTAKAALDNGALIINDITGLARPEMAKLAAKYKAAVVLMHIKGRPAVMQKNPRYHSLMDEMLRYFHTRIEAVTGLGVASEKIIIDPGIGFGKTLEHNLEILKRLSEFKILGRPIMAGVSRKSFIGKILGVGCQDRLSGTIAACALAIKSGARIVRVHDVKQIKQALKVAQAICGNR